MGFDLFMSGTVAAAREAVVLGHRAIALSHYCRGQQIDWEVAAEVTTKLLRELIEKPLASEAFWNVNYPTSLVGEDISVVHCPPDRKPHPVEFDTRDGDYQYCGDYHQRPRAAGTDVDVCFSGKISVSQVRLCIS